MKKILFAISMMTIAACSNTKVNYDASGTFEATEITISAEQSGKLLEFNINEGDQVKENQQLGVIDTVQLYLKARQIGATKIVYSSQKPEISKQIAVLQQQLAKAQQDAKRFEDLVNEGAGNKKQLEDAQNQVLVLQKQISAQQSTLNNSTQSLNAQMNSADVQQLQVLDQLQKCHITSPIAGTILQKYAEQGEFAVIGKPLAKIANINDIKLRAYITAEQLTSIKLGDIVTVYADEGVDGRKAYEGKITWISDKAEFTPKTIQTRDERANLVYAIKISVNNDGLIKSGMYGDVDFGKK